MNLRRVRAVASHNEFGTCKPRRYGSSASGHRRETTIDENSLARDPLFFCGFLGLRLRIQVSGRMVWIDQTRLQKG
jgi:hypothetical protein